MLSIIFAIFFVVSASLHGYVCEELFRSLAKIKIDADAVLPTENLQPGDIIYVNSDRAYMDFFVIHVWPLLKVPYILITHGGDSSSPGAYSYLLEDQKLLVWFGINPSIEHPKFCGIPIGVPNKNRGPHGNTHTLQRAIAYIQSHAEQYHSKLICSNFSPTQFRTAINLWLKKQTFIEDIPWTTPYKYWTTMAQYKFVLSPAGAGLDTYRTWEALLVGTIPILEHSLMDSILEGLPVLLINNWSEITPALLEQKYSEMISKNSWQSEKLSEQYWIEKILQHKKSVTYDDNYHLAQ